MRLPGLGPKTARRIWQELGITTVAALKAAAEGGQLRGHAGHRRRDRAEDHRGARCKPQAAEGPRRALLGTTLPRLRAVVAELAEHPASVEVSLAGSARRMRETVRDLDIIATATDPQALVDHFCGLPWVVDVAAKGPTKATVVSQEGLRFDLRVVPPASYGNLLQHFTGSKHHNVALREDAVRRGLSISEYSVTVVETGEEHSFATEEEVYAFLGYAWIPPELRENGGELAAARKGELPELVALRRPARRPAHAHDLVRRQGLARGDGRGRAGARLRVLRDLRPLAAAARRPAEAAVGADRRAQRASRAVPDPQGDRGQRAAGRLAGRLRRRARDARLGCRVGALALRPQPDRARARRRWRARTSTASGIRRTARSATARRRRSTSIACSRRRSRPGRSSSSTRSPTGSISPTCTLRAARDAGVKVVIDSDGHQVVGARLRDARRRPGTPGVADARRRAEHAHVEADREAEEEALTFHDDLDAGDRMGRGVPGARGRAAGRCRPVAPGDVRAVAAGRAAATRRAVRRCPARRRRADPAGHHALEPSALLRLVREHRLGAGDPRRAADRGAQRQRDDVARRRRRRPSSSS